MNITVLKVTGLDCIVIRAIPSINKLCNTYILSYLCPYVFFFYGNVYICFLCYNFKTVLCVNVFNFHVMCCDSSWTWLFVYIDVCFSKASTLTYTGGQAFSKLLNGLFLFSFIILCTVKKKKSPTWWLLQHFQMK